MNVYRSVYKVVSSLAVVLQFLCLDLALVSTQRKDFQRSKKIIKACMCTFRNSRIKSTHCQNFGTRGECAPAAWMKKETNSVGGDIPSVSISYILCYIIRIFFANRETFRECDFYTKIRNEATSRGSVSERIV